VKQIYILLSAIDNLIQAVHQLVVLIVMLVDSTLINIINVVSILQFHVRRCLRFHCLHLSYLRILEDVHRLFVIEVLEMLLVLILLVLGCDEAERLVHSLQDVEVFIDLLDLSLMKTVGLLFFRWRWPTVSRVGIVIGR